MEKKVNRKAETKQRTKRKESKLENKLKVNEKALQPIYGVSLKLSKKSSPHRFSNETLSEKLNSSPYSFLQNYKTKLLPPSQSNGANKRTVIVYSIPHISKMMSPIPHGCDCGSSKISSKDIHMISSLLGKF
jgi:hypothetical protein